MPLLEQVAQTTPELVVGIGIAASIEELPPLELEIELMLPWLTLPDGKS